MTDIILLVGAAAQQKPNMMSSLLPIVLVFVIFYFLLIRPQQKKAKEHQNFLGNLEKGTEVITNGGLVGKITGLTPTYVTIEVAPKVRVKVTRSSVAGLAPKAGAEGEQASQH